MSTTHSASATESAFAGVVIGAIPAALAYFVGWAYLYYYLAAFGIGITELELGVESIFIFAAPPVFWALTRYWWIVLLLVIVIGALLWRFESVYFTGATTLRRFPAISGFAFFLILMVLAMAVAPVVKRAAVERANEKWGRVGVRIQAAVDKTGAFSLQYLDFTQCMDRRALDLIFSDKSVSYLLCVSEINDSTGVVYEVRRTEPRLASVRQVRRIVD
jgi:hypothetical protein